jgi:hypothetical protein
MGNALINPPHLQGLRNLALQRRQCKLVESSFWGNMLAWKRFRGRKEVAGFVRRISGVWLRAVMLQA